MGREAGDTVTLDRLATALGGSCCLSPKPPPRVAPPSGGPTPTLTSSHGPLARATAAVPEVGRNDPCPCGSGKKYKKRHGVGR